MVYHALDYGLGDLGSRPARGSALCSWGGHFTLTVSSSAQGLVIVQKCRILFNFGNFSLDFFQK